MKLPRASCKGLARVHRLMSPGIYNPAAEQVLLDPACKLSRRLLVMILQRELMKEEGATGKRNTY